MHGNVSDARLVDDGTRRRRPRRPPRSGRRRRPVDVRDRPLRAREHDGDRRRSSSGSSRASRARRDSSSRRRCRSTARASTSAPSTAAVAPHPRPEEQLARARLGVRVPGVRPRARRRSGRASSKPLIPTSVYAITKRDHEELCLVVGGAYGIPTVALRFFNVYGPGQALSNPYTGVAAIFASRLLNGQAADRLRGRAAVARLHPRRRHRRGILLALESEDAVGQAVNLGTGRPSTVNDIARSWPTASASSIAAEVVGEVPRGRHPPLLRRHSPRARHCSASARRSLSRTGCATWSAGWRTRRPSTASTPRRASSSTRGLTPRESRTCTTWRSSSSRRTRPTGCGRASRPSSSTRATSSSTSSSPTTSRPTAPASSSRASSRTPASSRARTTASRTPTTGRWMTTDARYALFLNPDTEIVEGTFEELVRAMDERPEVGLVGVKQVTGGRRALPDDPPLPERVAGARRGARLGALAGPSASWLGERELDLAVYEQRARHATGRPARSCSPAARRCSARACSTSASSSTARSPTSASACDAAGWEIRHLPSMTIVHHAGKAGVNPRMEAQNAFARRHHALVHFGRSHRLAFLSAHSLRYGLRAAIPGGGEDGSRRREASRWALKVLWGAATSPFGPPPHQAVRVGPASGPPRQPRVG